MFSESDFEIYRHAWRYALAPDNESQLSDSQFKTLLIKGGWMVRNTFGFDCEQKTTFWYMIKDSYGDMNELTSNVRRKIRKAYEVYDYKIIDYRTIKEKGYQIINDTFKNYKVKDRKMSCSVFNEYLDCCEKKQYDYWGIFNKNTQQLVGFCAVHIWNYCCEYGKTGLYTEYKNSSSYPYYGLYHTMNEYYLKGKKFKYVTDGSRSITEHSNIQPFLEQNFKFRKAYCKLKIRYKWWFGIIVRVLLPFRNIIRNRNVKAVLKMHKMQS